MRNFNSFLELVESFVSKLKKENYEALKNFFPFKREIPIDFFHSKALIGASFRFFQGSGF